MNQSPVRTRVRRSSAPPSDPRIRDFLIEIAAMVAQEMYVDEMRRRTEQQAESDDSAASYGQVVTTT